MSDLISRDALLKELGESLQAVKGGTKWMMGTQQGLENAVVIVKEAPAVDAVEVVRCKDCKHFDDGECTMMSEPKERREYERWVTIVAEDDFCSCGERRKEDAVD